MRPLSPFLSNLKLRVSYGVLGNQSGIGRYDGTQLYNFGSGTGVLMDGSKVSIINTNGEIVSTERTWERIHNYNVALEFGFLAQGRLKLMEFKTSTSLFVVSVRANTDNKNPSIKRNKPKNEMVRSTCFICDVR